MTPLFPQMDETFVCYANKKAAIYAAFKELCDTNWCRQVELISVLSLSEQ
jgi:hypothetical protein